MEFSIAEENAVGSPFDAQYYGCPKDADPGTISLEANVVPGVGMSMGVFREGVRLVIQRIDLGYM